ncbi:MAG: hypothetical protein ACYDBB_00285 [Armatimonadota bacterium]
MSEREEHVAGNDDREDHSHEFVAIPRRRRRGARVLWVILSVLLILWGIYAGLGQLYHGPRNLKDVVAAMPGVPIFPLSTIARSNHLAQRTLAIPRLLMRMQGAKDVQAAVLQAPGDADFILYWYREVTPTQGWQLSGDELISHGRRLVYLRGQEGLQVLVGDTKGGLFSPVQLIYMTGLTAQQAQQLAALPREDPEPLVPAKPNNVTPPTPPIIAQPPTTTPVVPLPTMPTTAAASATITQLPPSTLTSPVVAKKPKPAPSKRKLRKPKPTVKPPRPAPPNVIDNVARTRPHEKVYPVKPYGPDPYVQPMTPAPTPPNEPAPSPDH